jgi:hypothetical protein
MRIDTKYDIGEYVYLKTDPDQKQRMIRGIFLRRNQISYELICGIEESYHEDFEFTKEKDVLKTLD